MIIAIDYNVCLNRNGYVNRNGQRQVVVELYQQGCRRIVNTHVHVRADDFACGRIQPSHPDYHLLNRRIRRIVRQLMELEDEMLDAGMAPTPRHITDAYEHHLTRSATISEWVSSVILPSGRRSVTKASYRTLQRSLEQFHPGLRISELCHDFIERWQEWMRHERHLSENTISIRLKALRCLVNEAVKRDVLRIDEDPFKHIRIPEIKARREFLTEQQLNQLEGFIPADSRLRHVRDAFLFCCYTGLRWGDFRRLTSSALCTSDAKTILVVNQHKTSRTVHIPISTLWGGRALRILHHYSTLEKLADIGNNRRCNADLRTIGHQAGITQHLHWHLARHTCGTLLNQRGLRMQEIQYILGHQKQETTERHYAETLLAQVDCSLQKAFLQELERSVSPKAGQLPQASDSSFG